jgi:hypothetical protein
VNDYWRIETSSLALICHNRHKRPADGEKGCPVAENSLSILETIGRLSGMSFRLEYEVTKIEPATISVTYQNDRIAADISHNASYEIEMEGRRAPSRRNAAFGDRVRHL